MLCIQCSSIATCNIYKANVSRDGGSTAKYNTTNLIKHPEMHHDKEHDFNQIKMKTIEKSS